MVEPLNTKVAEIVEKLHSALVIDPTYGKCVNLVLEYDDIEGAAALIATQQQEIERLRGLQPEFPPYPPDGDGLPRFGLRWNGPSEPLSVPMEDGYWTPYHLASLYRRHCNAAEQELSEVSRAIGSVRWMDPPDGGDVSLGEQVKRMRADLEAAQSRVQSLEEEVKRLREAVERSNTALNDWLNVYAGAFCNPDIVAEAQARIGEFGTIAYIASVTAQNRAALKEHGNG